MMRTTRSAVAVQCCLRSIRALPHHHRCHPLLTCRQLHSNNRRTTDFNSGFTGSYDPSSDAGRGPMFSKSSVGVPQFYPRDLKKRVDDYVIGQDRAKKTICATIFNHYQNVRRRHQHEHEDRNRRDKVTRQRFTRERELHQRRRDLHSAEGQHEDRVRAKRSVADILLQDENPDHRLLASQSLESDNAIDDPIEHLYESEDTSITPRVKIDKSNMLLIGPTGVGKTYILETLSKTINVPFSICDCNSLTQAGYIGQDVETCIERLLIEANYDLKATEYGIVVLDEFDKIARRETTTGRDVGGEGVQQALLKLVEGTKVTINVKDNRSSRSLPPGTTPHSSVGSSAPSQSPPAGGKVDQYTIDTTNILFVFCGAFVGLDKAIIKRVAKPSMGFGGEVKGRQTLSGDKQVLPPEAYTHLPHHNPFSAKTFTPLDLVAPDDLQSFGFIPELIGRLHNICALSPLSQNDLYRILTEPRNSLTAQYTALFETYPSRLHFTEKALLAIAEKAAKSGTGARGLKMEMERILAEPMFDAPLPHVLITEGSVRGTEKPGYWGKDGMFEVDRRMQEEELDKKPDRLSESSLESYKAAGQSGG